MNVSKLASLCFTSLVPLAVATTLLGACSENETPPPTHGAYDGGATAALPCVPNLDGKIDSNELQPQIGIAATYLVSPAGKTRQVDLAGVTNSSGKLVWNFAVDYADDGAVKVAAQPLEGKWFASSFPGLVGAVVVPLDAADTTESVYTIDEHGFYLHGVASTKEGTPDQTIYVYDKPITVYQFPLAPGASWKSTASVTGGTFRGLPFASKDTYEVSVDGAGQMELPDYTLTQALRVRTKVTIEPAAGQATSTRQVSFLFECLGEVARATSNLNEPEENFTTASELRRLGMSN
ncbi:hypothetical protein AKJ09_01850 [Labilithrix luteola]|uniref:Lipoprotein n=1 Tax=Labilithrix luteola TaxID=1391654 RepID=A0A0K1PP55_9BACT|nr:hypothetical protein [Labilithrix luteola]AKU95186.1 hypothetical protein AKJ09_01850 [Labilithrix luteola]